MWDEITLKRDLKWHSFSKEWHGVTDYGGVLDTPFKPGIANHALLFIFRPYIGNWIQPMACFATENAASGPILYELAMKAIVKLHQSRAMVKNVVCDGATSNKKAMELFGVSGIGKSTSLDTYSFLHPLDESIKIYWFTDVPHLLKCVRNNFLTHKRVQVIKTSFLVAYFH